MTLSDAEDRKDDAVTLSSADREHIRETLLDCKAEFEELIRTKEWYVTDVIDRIESSLEILNEQGS